MAADLRLEPVVVDAVAELRRQGVRTAVISNSWGSSPFDPYATFQLQERYDVVLISDRVGLRKPDPAIFELAVQKLGLPASKCVFVDDVACYLAPAEKLGMTTVHATDPATTVRELNRLFGGPPITI